MTESKKVTEVRELRPNTAVILRRSIITSSDCGSELFRF